MNRAKPKDKNKWNKEPRRDYTGRKQIQEILQNIKKKYQEKYMRNILKQKRKTDEENSLDELI